MYTGCAIHHYAGLGKQSQGISTALSVQKTSKRGGKIVNTSAERGGVFNTFNAQYN